MKISMQYRKLEDEDINLIKLITDALKEKFTTQEDMESRFDAHLLYITQKHGLNLLFDGNTRIIYTKAATYNSVIFGGKTLAAENLAPKQPKNKKGQNHDNHTASPRHGEKT